MPRYLIEMTGAHREAVLDALTFTLAGEWDPSSHTVRPSTMERARNAVLTAIPYGGRPRDDTELIRALAVELEEIRKAHNDEVDNIPECMLGRRSEARRLYVRAARRLGFRPSRVDHVYTKTGLEDAS